MTDNGQARQLFLKYLGSHFQMEREGEYDLYRRFNISREQERAWMREAQREALSRIALEADAVALLALVNRLTQMFEGWVDANTLAELPRILGAKVDQLDTFTLLRIGESVLEMAEALDKAHVGADAAASGRLFARAVLTKVLNSPFRVAEKYLETALYREFLTEERIMRRVRDSLARC